jgi:hypothetical protein
MHESVVEMQFAIQPRAAPAPGAHA